MQRQCFLDSRLEKHANPFASSFSTRKDVKSTGDASWQCPEATKVHFPGVRASKVKKAGCFHAGREHISHNVLLCPWSLAQNASGNADMFGY